jgi:hypothetical protein
VSKANKKQRAAKKRRKSAALSPPKKIKNNVLGEKRAVPRSQRVESADNTPAVVVEPIHSSQGNPYQTLAPYDETLLDTCRTRWQLGDWQGLAAIQTGRLTHHPERGRVALLIAAAHWQLGNAQQGQRFMQMALDAGVSQRQVAQILVSGVHQSLAGAHWCLAHHEQAHAHCRDAILSGGVPGDAELLASARMERIKHDELGEMNGR